MQPLWASDKLTLDQLLGITASLCWWDTIPHKQQWQDLICFTSWCHWERSSPSKVCGIYLCNSVAPCGHCTGKHHVWEYRICQAIISKIFVICSESSWEWRVEHSPNPSLSCDLDSLLSFLSDNAPSLNYDYWLNWQFSDHAYQCYADLNLGWQSSHNSIIIHNIYNIISQ